MGPEVHYRVYKSPPPILNTIHPIYTLQIGFFNPLNAELNPIRHLLALVGARHIVHVSRIRVKTHFILVFSSTLLSCKAYRTFIQSIHRRTVLFQKLTRNLFLTLHGHNVHRQQRQLSKFLMRYQQFARSCLLRGCGASFQVGVSAGKGFLCAPF